MNKIIFCTILQSALLCFDGVQETELIEYYGLKPELARLGVQLCFYIFCQKKNNQFIGY